MSTSELISSTTKKDKNYKKIIIILSKIIGTVIEKSVKYHEVNKTKEKKDTNFCSKEIPNISITNYILRLTKKINIEPSTLILGIIYFDKICNKGNIILSFLNVYRLILISLVLAIKFNEEYFETNEFYSKIGGLSNKSFNKLEIAVLKILNYKLYIKKDIYDNYINHISNFIESNLYVL
jgi:hypothetical protein